MKVGGGGYSETQTDEDFYTIIGSNLQISLEATITEITADVLEAKNGPGSRSTQQLRRRRT